MNKEKQRFKNRFKFKFFRFSSKDISRIRKMFDNPCACAEDKFLKDISHGEIPAGVVWVNDLFFGSIMFDSKRKIFNCYMDGKLIGDSDDFDSTQLIFKEFLFAQCRESVSTHGISS